MSEAWREMTREPDNDRRWIAVITYRTETGPVEVDHHVEEIEDLHMLVERGPDWNAIIKIEIVLNPKRVVFLGSTVEESEKR